MITRNNFYVLSGAMGGGKSAILSRLRELGVRCVAEPAREILAERKLLQATGAPELSADSFNQLMLLRSIHKYDDHDSVKVPVVFDRGIPDMVAYARLFRLDETPYSNAAKEFRYNPTLFYFPAWEEIYTTDEERKMSFEQAKAFGAAVRSIYEKCGYRILEVPRCSVEERAQFILNKIQVDE